MIPKVIHYCWFGRNPKSEIIQKCIESWKEFCPDYEIIEWNEDNFDVNAIEYTRDAYADEKYAFVSDYARLYVIFTQGGIYLDTDVLLHNSLDDLLKWDCWLASDDVRWINTGMGFGAVKNHPLIKSVMQAYHTRSFPADFCTKLDTPVFEREMPELKKSYENQIINNVLILGKRGYPKYARHFQTNTGQFFCEEQIREHATKITAWMNGERKDTISEKFRWKCRDIVRSPELVNYIEKNRGKKRSWILTFLFYDLWDCGPWYFIKRVYKKIIVK